MQYRKNFKNKLLLVDVFKFFKNLAHLYIKIPNGIIKTEARTVQAAGKADSLRVKRTVLMDM
jgi:hypothetical protein